LSTARLTIVPDVLWEGARGPQLTASFFTMRFGPLNIEKAFTNHKFHVGLHATFGLNDSHILIQYPSWSAKAFSEAIELVIARWVKLLDTGMCE